MISKFYTAYTVYTSYTVYTAYTLYVHVSYFFIPDSTDDAMQVIFTDFKRINETHFWSESSQKWLHQVADKDFDNLGALYWLRAPYKGPGMYTV